MARCLRLKKLFSVLVVCFFVSPSFGQILGGPNGERMSPQGDSIFGGEAASEGFGEGYVVNSTGQFSAGITSEEDGKLNRVGVVVTKNESLLADCVIRVQNRTGGNTASSFGVYEVNFDGPGALIVGGGVGATASETTFSWPADGSVYVVFWGWAGGAPTPAMINFEDPNPDPICLFNHANSQQDFIYSGDGVLFSQAGWNSQRISIVGGTDYDYEAGLIRAVFFDVNDDVISSQTFSAWTSPGSFTAPADAESVGLSVRSTFADFCFEGQEPSEDNGGGGEAPTPADPDGDGGDGGEPETDPDTEPDPEEEPEEEYEEPEGTVPELYAPELGELPPPFFPRTESALDVCYDVFRSLMQVWTITFRDAQAVDVVLIDVRSLSAGIPVFEVPVLPQHVTTEPWRSIASNLVFLFRSFVGIGVAVFVSCNTFFLFREVV